MGTKEDWLWAAFSCVFWVICEAILAGWRVEDHVETDLDTAFPANYVSWIIEGLGFGIMTLFRW
jgi:hypothetical protein